ncbi:MAG: hypothetical protein ABIG96_01410 [Candidatus Micrarchaeota archaeon]
MMKESLVYKKLSPDFGEHHDVVSEAFQNRLGLELREMSNRRQVLSALDLEISAIKSGQKRPEWSVTNGDKALHNYHLELIAARTALQRKWKLR